MEDVISKLRQERTALQARLEKIETAISEYDRWSASVAGLVGQVAENPSEPHTEAEDKPAVGVGPSRKGSSMKDFEDAVRLVLKDTPHPYQRAQLLSAIQRLGVVVVGKDPANTMTTRLSRMGDVINLKGFGYWLDHREYSRAGYIPHKEETSTPEDKDSKHLSDLL